MKINCIIVDDEPLAIRLLEEHIAKVPDLHLVGKSQNAMEAFKLLQSQQVDLMFLDIQMPDLTGIQFLHSLSHKPKTIFTTAYREFAVEGFELEAVDYLLKPITFERFFKSVSRVLATQNNIPGSNILHDYVIVKAGGFQHKLLLKDICYIESQGNDIKIFLQDAQTLIVKQTISDMETQLNAKGFVRVHRSFIVNPVFITAFNLAEMMVGNTPIPVGRSYKENAAKLIERLRK